MFDVFVLWVTVT